MTYGVASRQGALVRVLNLHRDEHALRLSLAQSERRRLHVVLAHHSVSVYYGRITDILRDIITQYILCNTVDIILYHGASYDIV